MANTTSITRRQLTNLNEPQQLRELNRQMEWIWHQLLGGLTEKAMSTTGIKQVTKRIETTVANELTVTDLEANAISAAMVNFMVANVDVANIDLANLNDLQAVFVGAANASIESADIDIAQIKRVSAGTAFIREGLGGKVYIDDLAVSEANIVNLAAGTVLLNDANGNLVELYVDNQGVVHTRAASYDGNDIINQNTLNGNRIIQNSITADRLNATDIFALNGTIMNLIGDRIDASRMNVGTLDASKVKIKNLSANYLNAGTVRFGSIQSVKHDPSLVVINENDSSTLYSGESIDNGWVVNPNRAILTGRLFSISNASSYAGRSGTVTFRSDIQALHQLQIGIFYNVINKSTGTVEYQWRNLGHIWHQPTYTSVNDAVENGSPDASGDIFGSIPGDDSSYTLTFPFEIPSQEELEEIARVDLNTYDVVFMQYDFFADFSKAKNAIVKFDDEPGVRYSYDFKIDETGLKISGLSIDQKGNLTTTGTITGIISGYLPLSGGALTGRLTFNQVANAIAYTGTKATYDMIKFIDNTGDEYGNGIAIGGGGATIIGGGESAATAAAQVTGGSEVLYLCNDGDVLVLSNLQNGWNDRKTFTFGANGTLTAPAFSGPLTGNVTGNCSGSAGSVAWGNVTGKPNVATTDTAQTFTGTKSWGSSGAGGQLNGAATNGGINSIRIGDDVWLGDCNAGGIMGMKSTGSNCGFFMYNSSGTQIGQLYFDGTNLICNKTIKADVTSWGGYTASFGTENTTDTWVPVMKSGTMQHRVLQSWLNNMSTVAIGHGGTGATQAHLALSNLFNGGGSATNITSYPSAPGIYRCIGTKVFSKMTPTSNYGLLVIMRSIYGMHLYCTSDSHLYVGYSGDSYAEPSTWRRCT